MKVLWSFYKGTHAGLLSSWCPRLKWDYSKLAVFSKLKHFLKHFFLEGGPEIIKVNGISWNLQDQDSASLKSYKNPPKGRYVCQGEGGFFSGAMSSYKLSKLPQNHLCISRSCYLNSTMLNLARFWFCIVICLFWYAICALGQMDVCLHLCQLVSTCHNLESPGRKASFEKLSIWPICGELSWLFTEVARLLWT